MTAGRGRDFTGAVMHGVAASDGVAGRAGTAGTAVIAADMADILVSAAASDAVLPFTAVALGWVAALLE